MAKIRKSTKLGAGRPPNAVAKSIETIERKVLHENLKFSAKLANDLDTLYKIQHQMALAEGKFKNISHSVQKSSVEACIERAEEFLYEEAVAKGAPESTDTEKTSKAKTRPENISLVNYK